MDCLEWLPHAFEDECPPRFSFSPPFPPDAVSAHLTETRIYRRICGGAALKDIAVEKVYEDVVTGDGRGGHNGRFIYVWLLRRTGRGWTREILMAEEFATCGDFCDDIRYSKLDIARDGARIAVVATKNGAPAGGWVVYTISGSSQVVDLRPKSGGARDLLREAPLHPPVREPAE